MPAPGPHVDTAAILGKHALLAAAVWAISAYTQSTAILYVALYVITTSAAAAALLPNVGTELRHEARCWTAVLCAGTLAVRLTLTVLSDMGEGGVSGAFGAEFSQTAGSLVGGHLPALFVYAIISVPVAWTLWLVQRWRLHGRTRRYDRIVRDARRQDKFQP